MAQKKVTSQDVVRDTKHMMALYQQMVEMYKGVRDTCSSLHGAILNLEERIRMLESGSRPEELSVEAEALKLPSAIPMSLIIGLLTAAISELKDKPRVQRLLRLVLAYLEIKNADSGGDTNGDPLKG